MPAVHRHSDARACGASTTVVGQSTVYVNNLLVSVKGDPNTHGAGSLNASVNPGRLFVEGIEVVLVGSSAAPDSLCPTLNGPHCGPSSTTGSPNVFAFE